MFALANDDLVIVSLPDVFSPHPSKSVYLPIYLLTILAVFIGVVIGFLIEYFRNYKLRKAFNENSKKLLHIEKELQKSKEQLLTEEEKIFNLLD